MNRIADFMLDVLDVASIVICKLVALAVLGFGVTVGVAVALWLIVRYVAPEILTQVL